LKIKFLIRMVGLSIIITFYKGEKFIYNCIDSLLQSYSSSGKRLNFEIILVIDSMDDALLAESNLTDRYYQYPLTVVRNPSNLGVAESRNKGLFKSKYCFFTVIDQDDYVERNYFSVLEKKLERHIPLYVLNGTLHFLFNNVKLPVFHFRPIINFKRLILKQTLIYTPGLLIFNADFVSKENMFIDASQSYKGCDDWAAYLKILAENKKKINYKFIDELIFVYAIHSENYSHNKAEMINSSKAVLNFIDARHRLSNKMGGYLKRSRKLLDFEYAKEVKKLCPMSLFCQHPYWFLQHYVFSFFIRDRLNRIVFQVRFRLSKFSKIY
jgi:teichuronic acid biosynthesis glycosyltransferase TuaG